MDILVDMKACRVEIEKMTKRTKEFEVFYDDYQGIEHILIDYDETYLLYDCDENWDIKAQYNLGPMIDEIISKNNTLTEDLEKGILYSHIIPGGCNG